MTEPCIVQEEWPQRSEKLKTNDIYQRCRASLRVNSSSENDCKEKKTYLAYDAGDKGVNCESKESVILLSGDNLNDYNDSHEKGFQSDSSANNCEFESSGPGSGYTSDKLDEASDNVKGTAANNLPAGPPRFQEERNEVNQLLHMIKTTNAALEKRLEQSGSHFKSLFMDYLLESQTNFQKLSHSLLVGLQINLIEKEIALLKGRVRGIDEVLEDGFPSLWRNESSQTDFHN